MTKKNVLFLRSGKPLGRCSMLGVGVAAAVGLIIVNLPGMLRAQDATPGAKPAVSAPAPPAAAVLSPSSSAEEYIINPNDLLDVYVYDVPELSHTYAVSPSGVVTMPLLSAPLQAAGLTPDHFARSLEEAYRQSGRLRRPEIAVSVSKSARPMMVTVDGAVKNPVVLAVAGPAKLVDILTQGGGLADDAGITLTVTRGPLALRDLAAGGGAASPTLTLEVKKVMDGSDAASATLVWPGDRVSVDRAGVYYVLGEVKAPGGYTLKNGHDELTVLRALALAGDVTGVAKKSNAVIIRKDVTAPEGRLEIKIDVGRILSGKSPDPKLQANDILFVPGSSGKKALKTFEALPGMVAGGAGAAAVYH